MKGKKEGNFAKCVMNVEIVTLKISKYNITTLMNVSFGFHFGSQHARRRIAVKIPGHDASS